MEKRTLGKILSGFGLLLFGIAVVLFVGAMPKYRPQKPFGDNWEIAVPLAVVGVVCIFVGLSWEMSRRK